MERQKIILAGSLAGLALLVGVIFYGCRQPPQMGADKQVFHAVDELYTAITARNEKHLEKCQRRLESLKEAGKIPDTAANHLEGIIATARQGNWRPAAERLHAFMKAQRREGRD